VRFLLPSPRFASLFTQRAAARHLLAALVMVAGCQHTPADLREWKADDHDRAEDQQKGRGGQARPPTRVAAQPSGSASASADPNAALVEVTWRNQCTLCHGRLGKGDGPQGPMVRAPDLTRADWQASVTDEQIIATIQNGKNRMPKFEFPPEVLRGLAARIRASKGR
jgi:mono/diheme cytochrome c family protein